MGETIRTYALRGLVGDRPSRRQVAVVGLTFGAVVLALPGLDTIDRPLPSWYLLLVPVGAAGAAAVAAYREYRFGGPARIVVVAAVTTLIVSLALVAALAGLSIAFGPEPSAALGYRFWELPIELQVAFLLGLAALLVVVYWVRRPGTCA